MSKRPLSQPVLREGDFFALMDIIVDWWYTLLKCVKMKCKYLAPRTILTECAKGQAGDKALNEN